MKGLMSICHICVCQDRREDNGRETVCVLPHPTTDYDTCDAFQILEGRLLGARLAELYNLIGLAWDVIMAMLREFEGRGDAAGHPGWPVCHPAALLRK